MDVAQWWHAYADLASAGGPLRWIWSSAVAFVVVALIWICVSRFVRFVGLAFTEGWKQGRDPERAQRRELHARLPQTSGESSNADTATSRPSTTPGSFRSGAMPLGTQ
jgi:hypothetical protein